jgi:hypothetical protein
MCKLKRKVVKVLTWKFISAPEFKCDGFLSATGEIWKRRK